MLKLSTARIRLALGVMSQIPLVLKIASGTSVALSGDGQIMAAGGRLDNSGGS